MKPTFYIELPVETGTRKPVLRYLRASSVVEIDPVPGDQVEAGRARCIVVLEDGHQVEAAIDAAQLREQLDAALVTLRNVPHTGGDEYDQEEVAIRYLERSLDLLEGSELLAGSHVVGTVEPSASQQLTTQELLTSAWARLRTIRPLGPSCRVCGCTDDDACEHPNGRPCRWVPEDVPGGEDELGPICSVCWEEADNSGGLRGPVPTTTEDHPNADAKTAGAAATTSDGSDQGAPLDRMGGIPGAAGARVAVLPAGAPGDAPSRQRGDGDGLLDRKPLGPFIAGGPVEARSLRLAQAHIEAAADLVSCFPDVEASKGGRTGAAGPSLGELLQETAFQLQEARGS